MGRNVLLRSVLGFPKDSRHRPSRAHVMKATSEDVSAIRRVYEEMPSVTAAGIARRMGLPEKDGIIAVTGRGFGLPNLAARRVRDAEKIQERLGSSARVNLEHELVRWAGGRMPIDQEKRKPKRVPYEPICGGSNRRAKLRYWAAKRADEKKKADAP